MADIPSHHMIYGTMADYLTGEQIVDTDDERYRQKLSRFLVKEKGYAKTDLEMRLKIETLFAGNFVVSKIDLVISLHGKRVILLRYGPGSLVTRERPALAAARILEPDYQIPLVVVTNGEDAEILDTYRGKEISHGLESIPGKEELQQMFSSLAFIPLVDQNRREKEARILNAFDLEVCCAGNPCALPEAPEG
ncbi:MAG: type I restriction enzyme HsdR N-terminal domain-containing protein [Proteobacteria bacterium]|nr:type I restriction enzyme HsdR N-terminal domain-containing protein [Pseudomonadota bacterium]MBU1715517.1 type I restriction enzyme HsdR N-terminal domain-containing protein [Pseudomonadota bacterium]